MSAIDLNLLRFGWEVFVTICGLGGGLVGLWASAKFARRESLETFATQLAKSQKDRDEQLSKSQQVRDERITRIEEQMRQAPKHADLVQLSSQVSALASRVANLEGQTERTNNLLEAIHDHLLNSK